MASIRTLGHRKDSASVVSDTPQISTIDRLMQLRDWARRVGMARKVAIGLALAALVAGVTTYALLTGNPPYGPDPRTIVIILLVDLVLLLCLGALVARRLVRLWAERRRGSAGSKLHIQLVAWFSIVAVAPAIIVAIFSALFFNLGVQSWFSERVRTALQESLAVAVAYTNEHRKVIQGDVLAMAIDLNRQAPRLASNPYILGQVVTAQARVRSLSEAIIFRGDGEIVARTPLSLGLDSDAVGTKALNKAKQGQIVFLESRNEDRIRALIRLDRFIDSYLYVSRFVEPQVLLHVEQTKKAVAAYESLEGERSVLEITFAIVFIVVAVLLLLVAVWLGLTFATRMFRPIGALIGAAEKVSEGDLTVRVLESSDENEISSLSRAFNRMTSQLENQRQELVVANQELEDRQRFTSAVLEGVSAGVIGVDSNRNINLPNRTASVLLGVDIDGLIGCPVSELMPEMASLLDSAERRPRRLVQDELSIERLGESRRLLVRVTVELANSNIVGFVITFDDVTELVTAQRTAAWADVARRIAHEIKNPLTPIRLSAERLKRRYADEIRTEPDVFARCTDTIIRQVVAIGRMVDEFSAFARMPSAVIKRDNVTELVRQSLFLQREAHPEIELIGDLPQKPIWLRCDERQIGQVMTNLLQNAIQSIEARESLQKGGLNKGCVEVRIMQLESVVELQVLDNGCGLPVAERDRLLEPYVSTRPKGAGLGLAIVKKIAEDHGARLTLGDREEEGAIVCLSFATNTMDTTDG